MSNTKQGITGYSTDRNGDEIFEYKNAKIKAILRNGILMTVVAFVIAMTRFKTKDKSMERILFEILILLGIALVIGLIFGIYRSIRTRNIRIVVGKKDVDVTLGKAHGVYAVEDFLKYDKDTSKGVMALDYRIAFRDPEGGSDLKISLPDFPTGLFVKMVDAITFRKAELSEETPEYTPFEGDTYKGAGSESNAKQVLLMFWGMTAFTVVVTAVLYVFRYVLHWLSGTMGSILLGTATLFSIGAILMVIYFTKTMKKADLDDIMDLSIGEKDLTINGKTYPFENILSIHMTSPILTKVFEEHRILKMDVRGEAETVEFFAGKRREPDGTEESVSEGCSCEYPALYAKIAELCKDRGIKFIEKE